MIMFKKLISGIFSLYLPVAIPFLFETPVKIGQIIKTVFIAILIMSSEVVVRSFAATSL